MSSRAAPHQTLHEMPRPWWRWLALVLGVVVFSIDTFTNVHGAIAVLYVVVLLLAADGLSRRGLLTASAVCAVLTVISFAVAHAHNIELSAVLRCITSLAAIAITTLLIVRSQTARHLLIESNRALASSEARYRAIFEQASVSLWEQDHSRLRKLLADLRASGVEDIDAHAAANPDFLPLCSSLVQTIAVNGATLPLLGARSRSELLGPLTPFVDNGRSFLSVVRAIFEGETRISGKGELVRLDGRRITVLFELNLPDHAQDFGRVVVGIVDITQREEIQEALATAQAELARASRVATLGAASASIAHELNQPLASVVMSGQACLRWLHRDPPELDAAVKSAERTVRDGERASQILQRIRGMLVRSERRAERLDIIALIDEAALLLEREIASRGARLIRIVPRTVPAVHGDRVELHQILINLISNGLNAMEDTPPGQRELIIEVTSDGPMVAVDVRDRGKGIAEADMPRLFEPFFTTRVGGMGMGLAICRTLIEAHGGELTAANHPEGGAVFRFTLELDQMRATG